MSATVRGATPRARAAATGRRPQSARFHRERDRRRLRAMALALACAGFLVTLVLGVVGLRVQQVRMSYRLDGLRAARAELEEVRARLSVEQASLKSLARIDSKARGELGMVPPGQDQVKLAREFVPGGSGLTSRTLTASADPAAPRSSPGSRVR